MEPFMAVAGASHKSPEQIEDLEKNQRQNGATSGTTPLFGYLFLLRGVYKLRPAGPLAACPIRNGLMRGLRCVS